MGDLSAHFDVKEFVRDGETLPAEYIGNLRALAPILEAIRAHVGRPVYVNSGYRSPEHNREIKGSATSQHMTASAADISVSSTRDAREADSREVVSWLVRERRDLPWDQAIFYADARGGHVHVSTSSNPRRQALYAPATGGYEAFDPFVGRGRQANVAAFVREHPRAVAGSLAALALVALVALVSRR